MKTAMRGTFLKKQKTKQNQNNNNKTPKEFSKGTWLTQGVENETLDLRVLGSSPSWA